MEKTGNAGEKPKKIAKLDKNTRLKKSLRLLAIFFEKI